MPTSYEFDWAAAAFEQSAAQLETILAPAITALGPETVNGGQLALVIDATIDASKANLARCIEDLYASAQTCRQRATDCRAYGDAVAAYRHELDQWSPLDPTDERPTWPSKPATWVDL